MKILYKFINEDWEKEKDIRVSLSQTLKTSLVNTRYVYVSSTHSNVNALSFPMSNRLGKFTRRFEFSVRICAAVSLPDHFLSLNTTICGKG